jgi:hypothetical protein
MKNTFENMALRPETQFFSPGLIRGTKVFYSYNQYASEELLSNKFT